MKYFRVDLIIVQRAEDKVAAIKAIRAMFGGLGLKESKDFVEQSPYVQTVLLTEQQVKNLTFHNFMRKVDTTTNYVGSGNGAVVYIERIEEYQNDARDLRMLGE